MKMKKVFIVSKGRRQVCVLFFISVTDDDDDKC
jgi:hypothetical protein